MAAKGLTIRDAAAQIGVSRNALHRVTQGKTPEVETYLRITKWMET
jgi:transcriptional regulator with XRE-family HTH domain